MATAFEIPEIHDDEEFVRAFWRDGFAVVRALFTRREIVRMRRAFDELQAIAAGLENDGKVMYQGTQFVIEHQKDQTRIHRIVWCAGVSPMLDEFGRDPRLLRPVALLLESREFDQLINQAHFKMPGDAVEFEWHQDSRHRRYGTELWSDVDGRGSFVETFTSIDPMRSDNGPLRFITGSHRYGHVSDENGAIPAELIDEDKAVELHLEPGDVAFFGPYVFHASGPNRGSRARRSFLNGFSLPGANRREYPGDTAGRRVDVTGATR